MPVGLCLSSCLPLCIKLYSSLWLCSRVRCWFYSLWLPPPATCLDEHNLQFARTCGASPMYRSGYPRVKLPGALRPPYRFSQNPSGDTPLSFVRFEHHRESVARKEAAFSQPFWAAIIAPSHVSEAQLPRCFGGAVRGRGGIR